MKCWKLTDKTDGEKVLLIEGQIYSPLDAAEAEIAAGSLCLGKWCVERKYKTQVCEPDRSTPYYDMRSEMQELSFDELIFKGGECIGAYHAEQIFIFDDEKTHYREKYLGEMKISYDQGIDFYDYYYLRSR